MRPSGHLERVQHSAHGLTESDFHPALSAALPRPRSDDSWVEVSSRPSSSSLSSVADEIVTTGLREQQIQNAARRRRRLRRTLSDNVRPARLPTAAGTSSQEEYDESESESDRVLSSSNEIQAEPSPLRSEYRPLETVSGGSYSSEADYEDDDENATAIGTRGSRAAFRPQPNAFSHPPASASRQQSSSTPQYGTRPARQSRHSYPSQHQHSPYNVISPSHHVDHDAALRASLSTLLSYAAATRGKSAAQPAVQPTSNRIEATSIGLVPESVALGTSTVPDAPSDQGKRKATTTTRSPSKDRRVAKKPRRGTAFAPNAVTGLEDVSPTLMTWVMGAGMLVLVSAISFSAGYVVGRETGRAEAATASEVGAGVVKREVLGAKGGLVRRWTGVAVGAAA